jgi:hypothetical protein
LFTLRHSTELELSWLVVEPSSRLLLATVSVFGNFCPKIIFHKKSSR